MNTLVRTVAEISITTPTGAELPSKRMSEIPNGTFFTGCVEFVPQLFYKPASNLVVSLVYVSNYFINGYDFLVQEYREVTLHINVEG